MAKSQNGYPVAATAAERSDLLTYIPVAGGHKIEVAKGDIAVVFEWLVTKLNQIQPVIWPGVWGFTYRPIRGQTTGFSNHASGSAVDWDATTHPRYSVRIVSKRYVGWTVSQVAKIRVLLAYADGVLRWGADFQNGPLDPMHFEINASPAAVHALANKIRGAMAPTPAPIVPTMGDKMQYRLVKINGIPGDFASNGFQGFWVGPGETVLKDFQYQMKHFDGATDTNVGEYTQTEFNHFFPGGVLGPLPPGWSRSTDGYTLIPPKA